MVRIHPPGRGAIILFFFFLFLGGEPGWSLMSILRQEGGERERAEWGGGGEREGGRCLNWEESAD